MNSTYKKTSPISKRVNKEKYASIVANFCAYILKRDFDVKQASLIENTNNHEVLTLAVYSDCLQSARIQWLLEATIACDYIASYINSKYNIPKFEINLVTTEKLIKEGIKLDNNQELSQEESLILEEIKNKVNQLNVTPSNKQKSNEFPLKIPVEQLVKFCQQNQLTKLSLFGSILTKDFNSESDIDLLAEFKPEQKPSLLKLANMESKLKQILSREVDLRLPTELSHTFREKVIAKALPIYNAKD